MSTHTFFSLCVPSPVATVQETKWDAQREKACINTYAHASASQICLQNLCGQQQNSPMADPTFGSKSGSQICLQNLCGRSKILRCGQPSENFAAARTCCASRFATLQLEHECQLIPFSRERLRRVLRKKAAVILHLHTFTSADLDLHTFTPADLDLHIHIWTLTSADLHVVQADLRPCSLNMNVNSYLFPESACEGFFVKKQPLYYIFTPSHLQI